MFIPKFLLTHSVTLATSIPNWLTLVAIVLLAIAFVYFLIGALRAKMKWEDEKEARRRFGGTAPKK